MFVSSYSPCYPLPSITPTSKIHFGYETPSILDELTVNEKPNEEELKRAIDLMYEIESTEFKERNLALNPRYLDDGVETRYAKYLPYRNNPKAYFCILTDDKNDVVAMSFLGPSNRNSETTANLWLNYVRDDYRKKGIGTWFIEKRMEKAKEFGYRYAEVPIWEGDEVKKNFWSRRGFYKTDNLHSGVTWMKKDL